MPVTRRHALRTCLGCCAAALALPGPAAGADGRPEFTFAELAPGVWMHTSWARLDTGQWFPSNGMVIAGPARVLMADTAWTPDQTEMLLGRLPEVASGKPVDLFITHFHDDRLGGIGVTAARGIVSHAFARTVAEARGHGAGAIDRALTPDSHAFDLGGRVVEAFYPGPGHTEDNAVVHDRESGVVFGGCMMRAAAATDLGNTADADIARWGRSVMAVAARYPDAGTVIPGHGRPGGRDIFTHTAALAEARLRR